MFLVQWKLAIFSIAFAASKGMATFLGMPPHFNKLYCKMALPLDLSDEALVSDAATLEAAIAQLGADGWNLDGQIYRSSLARLRLVTSKYRVQVWEARTAQADECIPSVQ